MCLFNPNQTIIAFYKVSFSCFSSLAFPRLFAVKVVPRLRLDRSLKATARRRSGLPAPVGRVAAQPPSAPPLAYSSSPCQTAKVMLLASGCAAGDSGGEMLIEHQGGVAYVSSSFGWCYRFPFSSASVCSACFLGRFFVPFPRVWCCFWRCCGG